MHTRLKSRLSNKLITSLSIPSSFISGSFIFTNDSKSFSFKFLDPNKVVIKGPTNLYAEAFTHLFGSLYFDK